MNINFSNDPAFKMLNRLDLATRYDLTLCNSQLVNLRHCSPDDCGHDQAGNRIERHRKELRRPTIFQRKRLSKPSGDQSLTGRSIKHFTNS